MTAAYLNFNISRDHFLCLNTFAEKNKALRQAVYRIYISSLALGTAHFFEIFKLLGYSLCLIILFYRRVCSNPRLLRSFLKGATIEAHNYIYQNMHSVVTSS